MTAGPGTGPGAGSGTRPGARPQTQPAAGTATSTAAHAAGVTPHAATVLGIEELAAQLSFVTLDQFLAILPDGLKVLHHNGSDALLRWVEPSELDDPAPYLMDGEFVLTAGLPFVGDGATPHAIGAYVQRLVHAKVSALGFGITPYHDAVPPALVKACRKHDLTLIEIPPSIPFAAIGLRFAQLLESDSAAVFRQLAEANRSLMRAGLSARPERELLETLTQRLPCWAVLVGSDGKVRAKSGRGAPDLPTLGPLLARLLAGSGPRIEVDSFQGSANVYGHPLRSTRDATLGALVIGSEQRPTPAQNSVVSSTVGLLELLSRQRTSGSLAPSQLAVALLLHPDTITGGSNRQVNSARDLLAQSISATRAAPMRVVQGINVDDPNWRSGDGPVRELLQWRRIFDTKMVEITDYGFAAITRLKVDDGLVAEVEKLGWRLVIGEPAEINTLPDAYQRVTSLRARAASSHHSVRAEEVSWSVSGLLGREAGGMLAAQVFAPLLALPAERRDPLLAVLRAWLRQNGSWDGTAKALGLHRNSVRRQIGVAGQILNVDLNDAQVRAELLIAQQFLGPSLAPELSPTLE